MEKSVGGNKAQRILRLYELLCAGTRVDSRRIQDQFGVKPWTVKKDVRELRAYFCNVYGDADAVGYDREKRSYELRRWGRGVLTPQQALAAAKVLLASRAFTHEEMGALLDGVCASVPPADQEPIRRIVGGERQGYQPIRTAQPLLERLWRMGEYICGGDIVRFRYTRQDGKAFERRAQPVALIFDEFYFYVLAHYVPRRGARPVTLRLDRMADVEPTGEKAAPSAPLNNESEMRAEAQYMYAGREMTIRFRFWGDSLDSVRDRFPGIFEEERDEQGRAVVRARVLGDGIKMRLLSQMDRLEVLEPPSLREEMKRIADRLSAIYRAPAPK